MTDCREHTAAIRSIRLVVVLGVHTLLAAQGLWAQEAALTRGADAEALYQQALSAQTVDERIALLEQCLELDQSHLEAMYGLASALWETGDAAGCLAALSQARQAGDGQIRAEWVQRAAQELAAAALDPTNEARIERLKVAVGLNPGLAEAWLQLAECYWLAGLRPESAAALTEARAARATIPTEPWQSRATEEFHRAFTPVLIEKIRHLEICVALDPARSKAWYNLGNAYYDNGQVQKAADAYARAVAITPDYDRALWNHALALVALDRPEEALTALGKHLELQETPQDQRRTEDFLAYVRHLISRRRPGVVYLMDGDLFTARSGNPAMTQTKLTESGDIARALLSPNRNIVALVRGESRLATWDLVLQRLREHGLPEAGPVLDLAWASDSERIALVKGTGADPSSGDVFLLDPRTEDLERVTQDGVNARIAWAPDGASVAYVKTQGPKAGLTAAKLADKTERLLAPSIEGVHITALRWSPTGKHIAYLQTRPDGLSSLAVISADGSERFDTQAQVKGERIAWSGSGRYVVFEAPAEVGLQGLYCWDVETKDGAEIGINRSPIAFSVAPTADADTRGMVAAAPLPREGATSIDDSVIFVAAFPGKFSRRVLALSETSYASEITWDDRGELIGIVVGHLETDRRGLFEIVTIKPVVGAPDPQFLALGLAPNHSAPRLLGLIPPALGQGEPGGQVERDEVTNRGTDDGE